MPWSNRKQTQPGDVESEHAECILLQSMVLYKKELIIIMKIKKRGLVITA